MKKLEHKILKYDQVEWRKLKWFQPEDLKSTTQEKIDKLKRSMLNNGFMSPFYVWENNGTTLIMDGHYRERALKEMEAEGIKIPNKLPALYLDIKNKKEAIKAVMSFNSHYAELNKKATFEFIKPLNFDEVKLEFEPFTLKFDYPQPEIEEDEPPEVLEKAQSKIGDLYELGSHRILCGDCTDKNQVDKLMNGHKIDMVFTDPPYGVDYSSKNEYLNTLDKGNCIQTTVKNDNIKKEDISKILLESFKNITNILNKYNSFYVCSAQAGELQIKMMMQAGLKFRHMIIWVKNNHVLGRCDYMYKHEPILYGWNNVHKFYKAGEQKYSVWNYDKPLKNDLHPTMKPIKLISNALLNSSLENMNIYDCFMGSGSTLIACEQTKRICYGMEIESLYIDVIIQRWVNYTGIETIKKNGKEITWKNIKK